MENFVEIRQIADAYSADLIFLLEPCLFQSDASAATSLLSSDYKVFLNSDDLYEPDIPLLKNRAHGGTMTCWKYTLDPYITVLGTETSRITPILLEMPGFQSSVHINIYLPTAGREAEFIDCLASLQATIDKISDEYPSALAYIRGDANASYIPRIASKRDLIFKHFYEDNYFTPLEMRHKTYHHFMGFGKSDSSIDVVLSSTVSSDGTPSSSTESLINILCSKEDARTCNSHHDAILSTFSLNFFESPEVTQCQAPTIQNQRHKIIWSEENLPAYCDLINPVLLELQSVWLDSSSQVSMAVLISQTNTVLSAAAKATQKVIDLSKTSKPKKTKISEELLTASSSVKSALLNFREVQNEANSDNDIDVARAELSAARSNLQQAKRRSTLSSELERDEKLHTILSSNPRSLFQSVKSSRRASVSIQKLKVKSEIYTGKNVAMGFFKSITDLKTINEEELLNCKMYQDFLTDHKNILEICKSGQKIPQISLEASEKH